MSQEHRNAPLKIDPTTISRFKKDRLLLEFSEDDFRDKVVRPLFLRMGLEDGRDTCGPTEHGKDCIFLTPNKINGIDIYCVQTKKGKLNLGSKANDNLISAVTQLRTALATDVVILSRRVRAKPTKVILCASGKINDAARNHIANELNNDPRLVFRDADELVPDIDKHYKELWYGIDADRNPYLQGFQADLLRANEVVPLSELGLSAESSIPIAEDMYLPLFCHRMTSRRKKHCGQVTLEPHIEEFKISGLLTRRERQILLLGDAGDGKTSALRHLALSSVKKALESGVVTTIPILIRAVDIVRSTKDLVELLANITLAFSKAAKPAFGIEDLNRGLVTVYVDALDEVPDSEDRSSVLQLLKEFHTQYPQCQIILTARPYEAILSLPDVKDYDRFYISEIDVRNTRSLINRLAQGRALPAEATQELMRQLQDMHGFKLNPLLLTIFVVTSDHRRRDVPANITELLKKFTELLLGRWDQQKGLAQQYQAPLKDFLLCSVGLTMHEQRTTFISEAEFRHIISQELVHRGYDADVDVLMNELLYRSGLLRVDNGRIEFRHFLLQEFFAGRGVKAGTYFKDRVYDEWWRKAIVFFFGEHPTNEDQIKGVIEEAKMLTDAKLYHAAISIGLAAQACYLAKVDDKRDIIEWVIRALARTHRPFVAHLEEDNQKYPLREFIEYYIFARDAVACKSIQVQCNGKHILQGDMFSEDHGEDKDAVMFWFIVGLMECGKLAEAEDLLRRFHPEDARFLLALHLGSFLIAHLRISTAQEKRKALEICEMLAPKIENLRAQVLAEMKSLLLEVRSGTLQALPFDAEGDNS